MQGRKIFRGGGTISGWWSSSTCSSFRSLTHAVSKLLAGKNEVNPFLLLKCVLGFTFISLMLLPLLKTRGWSLSAPDTRGIGAGIPVGKVGDEVRGYEHDGKAGLFAWLHIRLQQDSPIMSASWNDLGNIQSNLTHRNDSLLPLSRGQHLFSHFRVSPGPNEGVLGTVISTTSK